MTVTCLSGYLNLWIHCTSNANCISSRVRQLLESLSNFKNKSMVLKCSFMKYRILIGSMLNTFLGSTFTAAPLFTGRDVSYRTVKSLFSLIFSNTDSNSLSTTIPCKISNIKVKYRYIICGWKQFNESLNHVGKINFKTLYTYREIEFLKTRVFCAKQTTQKYWRHRCRNRILWKLKKLRGVVKRVHVSSVPLTSITLHLLTLQSLHHFY